MIGSIMKYIGDDLSEQAALIDDVEGYESLGIPTGTLLIVFKMLDSSHIECRYWSKEYNEHRIVNFYRFEIEEL